MPWQQLHLVYTVDSEKSWGFSESNFSYLQWFSQVPASSEVLKLIGARLPLGWNRRQFKIHGRLARHTLLNSVNSWKCPMSSWSSGQVPLPHWAGMPQLLRGRRFEPHCHPMLYLTVTVDISQYIRGFAPFCNDSDQRCANLHRASQRASWSTLKVWSIHQHHCCMLQTIADVKFAL